jgi:hypothetical protein
MGKRKPNWHSTCFIDYGSIDCPARGTSGDPGIVNAFTAAARRLGQAFPATL